MRSRRFGARAWIACCLISFALGGLVHAATFNGTVFEDVNYGGGAGRSLAASSGVGIAGVRVELYNVGTGALVASMNTLAGGTYSLSSGGTSAQMRVRVVNGTVRSSRAGGSGCTTCVPVQTYRTEGSGNGIVAVTNRVGGEDPRYVDAISNTAPVAYGTLTVAATRLPQSITTVTPANNGSIINNIDFGFNFDTIVNTRDVTACAATTASYPCQGSLRQFIINSDALGGEGALVQSGNGQLDGATTFLPSGFESSIFMIPDGTANAGQNTGYTNQLNGSGVAMITLGAALTIAGPSTRLDATTQTVNVGNDNPGTLGTGGTVGVDGISLPTFQRPEVQLTAGDTTVTLGGTGSAILGFALQRGYILLSGSNCVARNNLVGMTATGSSATNSGAAYGITFTGSSATVRSNFVTVNNSGIRTDGGGMGSVISFNEVARPTSGHTNTFDGILLVGVVSSIQITANLARDQEGGGIEVGHGGGAAATNITVSNNTVRGNGFVNVGGGAASSEPIGIDAFAATGSGLVFSRNLVTGNAGPGIVVITSTGVTISQNSFSSNGGLSIDLDPRGLDPNAMGAPQGLTLNDNGDGDTGPNGLRNYAVISSAILVAGELSFRGFARPGSAIELYIAQADPTNFGEGLTYLGTFTEGTAADLDATTGLYGPAAINGILQGTDNTNRFSFRVTAPPGVAIGTTLSSTATLSGETSEFGGNVVVTAGPNLQVTKLVAPLTDPVNNGTNPKSIPGSTQRYTVRVTNQGTGPVDNNSVLIVDKIPTNTKMFVGNLGAPGSGPVAFVNGTPSSALTWTFTALNNLTDDLDFSNDGGATWTYVPTLDAQQCDAAVTDIRMRPKGTMPGQSTGSPTFDLQFRVVVN
jgi:parallel beta-helix repeat protein